MSKHRVKIESLKAGVRLSETGPHPKAPSKKAYHAELRELQLKMLRIQQGFHHEQQRGIVVLEGWDAGGKGGALRRLTEKLDPRSFRVHATSAPTPVEQGIHYMWRFWRNLPKPGRIAIFDRSWYGRVLVERVEQFATPAEWKRAYHEINEFEHMLIDDGVRIVKLFLHISPEEQLERFAERLSNPYKRWKLTSDDIRNRERWGEYVEAIEDMLEKTSTKSVPWKLVLADYKWHARLEVMRTVVEALGKGLNLEKPRLNMDVIREAKAKLGLDANIETPESST